MGTPLEALRIAMAKPDAANAEDLRTICFSEFGTHKFSDLTERQQWQLVEMVDWEADIPVPSHPTVGYYRRHPKNDRL